MAEHTEPNGATSMNEQAEPTPEATEPTEPGRFRKKPVVIDALRFDRTNGTIAAKWCGGRWVAEVKPSDSSDVSEWIVIPTLEGNMRADVGDWIIRGVAGEFYPCKPDIFAATYEPEVPS